MPIAASVPMEGGTSGSLLEGVASAGSLPLPRGALFVDVGGLAATGLVHVVVLASWPPSGKVGVSAKTICSLAG